MCNYILNQLDTADSESVGPLEDIIVNAMKHLQDSSYFQSLSEEEQNTEKEKLLETYDNNINEVIKGKYSDFVDERLLQLKANQQRNGQKRRYDNRMDEWAAMQNEFSFLGAAARGQEKDKEKVKEGEKRVVEKPQEKLIS